MNFLILLECQDQYLKKLNIVNVIKKSLDFIKISSKNND